MTLRHYSYAIASHIGFILLWQVVVMLADVPTYVLIPGFILHELTVAKQVRQRTPAPHARARVHTHTRAGTHITTQMGG